MTLWRLVKFAARSLYEFVDEVRREIRRDREERSGYATVIDLGKVRAARKSSDAPKRAS